MKKFPIAVAIFLTYTTILTALPVSLDKATQTANLYLEELEKSNAFSLCNCTPIKKDEKTVAYIAELDPQGFIAIAPDTDIEPIISYSFRSNFIQDEDNLLYYMLTKDMEMRLQALSLLPQEQIQKHNTKWENYKQGSIIPISMKDFQQWPAEGSTSTGGWIETTWDQSYPYNMFCPIDPDTGSRCVVGCVATAMAMIIHYHEYVGDVYFNFFDSYTTWNGIHIDGDSEELDFPNFEELNEYLDTLAVHYQNNVPLTQEDIAALNFACGISVQMEYSSSGSGSWTALVEGALLNKFGYDSALWMDYDEANFFDSLSTNMMNAKPAELSIIKADGTGGHAINCDGYNTNDFYHLNFGWGATSPEPINEAWYLLPEGMPAGYSVVTGVVLNIEGGDRPLTVTGNVSANGQDPTGTLITLEGKHNYTGAVDNPDGFYEIPVVFPGYYTATAILNRVYYQTKEVYIDSLNTVINFNLFNYESVDGIVSTSDGTDPTGTLINFIGENNYSTTVDNPDGLYEIPDVLPGHYTAIASLNRTYYQRKEVDIDSTNMTVDFLLDNYSYSTDLHYYNIPFHIFEMPYEYSLEVSARFTPDELQDHTGSLISSVSFLPPTSPDSCDITIKIYEGGSPDNPPGNLVYESEITDFDMDNFVEHDLTIPIPIQPDLEYWVGYHITTDGKVAWLDEGPGIQGKGAWLKHSAWVDVSQNPNFNGNWMVGMTTASLSVSPDTPQEPLIKLELTNYPNPFSTSTTISFNTHSASWRTESAEIKIYNIKGQLIRQFNPPAGGQKFKINNEVVWDGNDQTGRQVPSGIYFYKLNIGEKSEVKKMLLIK
jgi:hypothetical protein